MNIIFDKKPTTASVLFIVLMWLFMIAMAISFSGCKSRKVNKSKSVTVDKSVTAEKKEKRDSTGTKISGKKTETETKKDSTGYIKKTVTEYYEPSDKIPAGSPKTKTEFEAGQKKSEGNKKAISEDFLDHSEISGSVSETNSRNDVKTQNKDKKIDAKMDWIQMGVGIGIAVLIVFCVYIWYVRTK